MKTISRQTYDMIFESSPSGRTDSASENSSIEEKKFIEEYADLDSFLDECLRPMKSEVIATNWKNDPEFNTLKNRCEDFKNYLKNYRKEGPRNGGSSSRSLKKTMQDARKIKAGTIIEDRYEILELKASGGFGDVYKGTHVQLKKIIALKILQGNKIKNRQTRERFFREAKLMASIDHPNVVKIHDVGEFNGQIYLVMDFIEGMNLEDFLNAGKELEIPQKLKLMVQLSEAISAIHQRGIIHRDIKPSNIMITDGMRPLLMDFGIARDHESREIESKNLTLDGHLMGTPQYMSPEQFKNPSRISKTSDVYSLGITFYQIATGRLPIKGKTYFELYENHQKTLPVPPHTISRNLPPKMSRVVSKMLKKDPAKRYRDGHEVSNALQGIRSPSISHRVCMTVLLFALGLLGVFAVFQFRSKSIGEIGRSPVPAATGVKPLVNSSFLADEWYSQPRIFSVIPFGKGGEKDSYFSDAIVTSLSGMGYDLVERENIENVLKELALNKQESFSLETSVRIGKLVGAHFIVTGNISSFEGKKQISLRAFNVETSEVLGVVFMDPSMPEEATKDLLKKMDSRLLFRSTIASLSESNVTLKHGNFHGATKAMRLRVLNNKATTIGLLEIDQTTRESATAKIIAAEDKLEPGLRVEEIKPNN